MKNYYLTILAITCICVSQPAFAAEQTDKIDGDKLQQQAEEILESEPGAKQVTLKVAVEPKTLPNKNAVSFEDFDLNSDGILARDEVGEKLFKVFDLDGNEVIDNIEMKKPSLIVFTPAEKTTIEVIDYHAQDKPVKTSITQQQFLHASKLSRFDKDQDGLSPLDFLEVSFAKLNVKDDAVIDLYEWKRAYADSVKPEHEEDYNYN